MHSKFTGVSASSIETAKKKPLAAEGENNAVSCRQPATGSHNS